MPEWQRKNRSDVASSTAPKPTCGWPPGRTPGPSSRWAASAPEASPSRVRKLRSVRAPTLVLRGSDDPLVPLAGGEDTAAAIPGAHLRVVPGMGHFLLEALVPLLVDEIAAHCLKVEDAAQSRFARAAGSSP